MHRTILMNAIGQRRWARAILGAAVGGALQLASEAAFALSCGGHTLPLPLPADGATDVPTNTLVWTQRGVGDMAPPRLVGPDGLVPTTERFMRVATPFYNVELLSVLVPEAELEPDTRYTIERDQESYSGVLETRRSRFTTGEGPAASVPSPPEVLAVEATADYRWDGTVGRWVELEFAPPSGILFGDIEGRLGEVTGVADLLLDAGAGFEPGLLDADTPALFWPTLSPSIAAGHHDCGSWPAPGVDAYAARFGVLDVTGRFSGWTETTELRLLPIEEAQALAAERQAEREAEAAATVRRMRESHDRGLLSCATRAPASSRGGLGAVTLALSVVALWAARRRV